MERRYLVAALAIIATFAVFTHGFHALQRVSFDHSEFENFEAIAAARCWANSAAQSVAKVRAHFRHDYSPEQAQMVAEMNMPAMESTIAEQMNRQSQAISQCARARALQEAERARRDAMRVQKQYSKAYSFAAPDPVIFSDNLSSQINQRVQEQLAKNQMSLQIAQERLASIEIPAVDVDAQIAATNIPNVKCKVKLSRQAIRDSMRGFQYGFTSK